MFKSAIGIILCVALFCPVVVWLYATLQVPPAPSPPRYIAGVNPEPAEQTSFLVGLLMVPSCLFGFAYLTRRWGPEGRRWRRALLAAEVGLAAVLIGVVCLASRSVEDVEKLNHYHLRLNPFFESP